MKVILAGLPFEVSPPEKLTAEDRRALAGLSRFAAPLAKASVFELRLSEAPPWESDDPDLFPLGAPAVVRCEPDRVRLSHRTFIAEVEPLSQRGSLFRMTDEPFPIELSLRLALCCRLPLERGLPLHAAGLAAGGRGLVFFGPSGAGKSTLAGLSPYPVFSDELVAIALGPGGFQLRATGFWGTLNGGEVQKVVRLAALVSLEKGADFVLEALDKKDAFRQLLHVVLVPSAPWLWTPALAVLNRLVSEVPVYRMAWSPARPPWRELQELWAGSA